MSGLLAVFGPQLPTDAQWAVARERMGTLGTERWQVVGGEGGALAVGRYAWEDATDFSNGVLVAEDGGLIVAADASLYHRDALVRALSGAGISPRSLAPAHLLLAAYRAWGDRLCDWIDGDFAVVVWDRAAGRVFAVRDLTGRRPLYFAQRGDQFAVSSSVRALVDLPFVSNTLNLPALGAQAAGLLWSAGADTAFRDVRVLRAAHVMVWNGVGPARVTRFWSPPSAPARDAGDLQEAAIHLRRLLQDAARERLADGVTTVWMSGGWDSSAVFAAGRSGLAEPSRIRPVSISYPEGDPGREDELIQAIAGYWGADVHWIDSEQIPLLDGLVERAAAMDEPPAHLYELWNVALARGTRAVGSRVALDGAGGDQLFQVSDVVMADLLRTGRWRDLRRHAQARGLGRSRVLRATVQPLLPRWALRSAQMVLRRRLPLHYLERPMTRWIRRDFAARYALRDRDLAELGGTSATSLAHAETQCYLLPPVWAWGAAYMHRALLAEGVETRSPLLDRRVMDFALRRPVAERAQDRDTKVLLRMAMSGLLPPEVLATRRYRTGVTVGFSRARMREAYPALFDAAFAEDLRLADLGIVDPAKLRLAAAAWRERGDEFERVNLFHTLKVEFWLRGLERPLQNAGRPTAEEHHPMSVAG
jgi:asparagine synthase (glutamine-hydrolysing)